MVKHNCRTKKVEGHHFQIRSGGTASKQLSLLRYEWRTIRRTGKSFVVTHYVILNVISRTASW